nr:AbrB/MazE/SpoVT family DNA-binding domain-containing protein [Reyranella sp. CPCC 100927]
MVWIDSKALFTLLCGHSKQGIARMSTLTVSAKGQVTLRKDVLKHLGVQPGEKIIVENGPSLSIEEMNKITAGRR